MAKFQIQLGGKWTDYEGSEDKVLKRAYMAGFQNAKFSVRGQEYTYDFKKMHQINKDSKKTREIRPPHKMKPPTNPIVPPGKTTVVKVQAGWPGTTQLVSHPSSKGAHIAVAVPPGAKVGQTMLVPVPDISDSTILAEPKVGEIGGYDAGGKPKAGWSTGGKIAAGAAVVGVGGVAVGGAVLGVAAGGLLGDEAAGFAGGIIDGAGAVASDAGTWASGAAADVGEWAGDAGDFIIDGAEDVGDFIMDLF